MKVLFAVSSESISEAIIKRYQKEYKEILSYKNVYYFNAILKEIQKDKTYDRIIISEDLEPFSNNNYDTIDKFIFEKLDSISDEAHDSQGKETSIILICTDRRVKGNAFLVKLFGIGVYNALLGNDRSMDEVCKLINRPRGKKEAKIYYRIDTEDVNYKAENENEVSEVEIQNILAHFKKLGKNTAKYSESFNNIAVQYTDEQLKIIVNCLPINVKAVLEANCERYQQLMAVTGSIASVKGMVANTVEGTIRKEISEKKVGQAGNITKPIVIPSAVRNAKNPSNTVVRKATTANVSAPSQANPNQVVTSRVAPSQVTPRVAGAGPQVQQARPQANQQVAPQARPVQPQAPMGQRNTIVRAPQSPAQPTTMKASSGVVARPANSNPNITGASSASGANKVLRPNVASSGNVIAQKKAEATTAMPKVNKPVPEEEELLPGFEDLEDLDDENNTMLPGMEFDEVDDNGLLPGVESDEEELDDNGLLPGMEDLQDLDETADDELDLGIEEGLENNVEDVADDEDLLVGVEEEPEAEEIETEDVEDEGTSKRGRGRPRKTLVGNIGVKPKGKRGRPRKVVEEEDSSSMLPGLEDDFGEQDVIEDFGASNEVVEDDGELLPGMIDETEQVDEEDVMLPGFEDEEAGEYEETEELPEEYEEVAEDGEEYANEAEDANAGASQEILYDDNGMPIEQYDDIPEEEYDDGEYTEEVSLPGLDDLDDFDASSDENAELTDLDDESYEEVDDDSTLIPGVNEPTEEDSGTMLPGFDDNSSAEDEEETLLPGMGFEDETDVDDMNMSSQSSYNQNSLESIKPRVDYSMSSLNSLITKDKKIVTFIGTSKNGVSFLVNNLAALFSSLGINTAILDMTKNRNSYYIYTKNEEELRTIAFNSVEKLQNGYAEGIRVDKNLTVYTSLPNDGKDYSNAEPILSTLVQNHSLILIDCDYDTDVSYFASCQEMYLVQSMDILTIQPLTAFLRELKTKGVLEPEKIRVVVNKELKVRSLSIKAIIGGLSYYNDPAMSFMTELFNKDIVKACTIPFEDNAYSKYLEGIVNCTISLNGFSKAFLSKLKVLGDMVYPLTSKQSYNNRPVEYNRNAFSNSMNDTLNKMRKKY